MSDATRLDRAPEERWQHGQLAQWDATGVQSVASTITYLKETGHIDDADVDASDRFYRDVLQTSGWTSVANGDAGGYLAVARALSWFEIRLAFAVIIDRMTVEYLAEAGGMPFETMRKHIIHSIKKVTGTYASYDRDNGNLYRYR